MSTLVIAIGNPLRRDDGVAHCVQLPLGMHRRAVLQLTPEIAEQIARYDLVFFVDADVTAKQVRIEPIDCAASPARSRLTHVSRPSEIVALARALFAFTGDAYTCHIPIVDISPGQGLTARTRDFAEQAACEIYKIGQSHENSRPHLAGRLPRVGSAR